MNESTIAILADPKISAALLQNLQNFEFSFVFSTDINLTRRVRLTLLCMEGSTFEVPYSPWIAWDQTGNADMITKAYQNGARAVFPKDTPLNIILDSMQRTMHELIQQVTEITPRRQYVYHRGEVILLEPGAVLYVKEGILSTTMIHQDGTNVLLGLSGTGQVIVGHPNDSCHIQILAYSDSKVEIESWETAIDQPDFPKKLKIRIQHLEGWSAMQARTSLSQRVLGIMGLLAGQFGQAHELGILINVRITHAQLASAVGSTRTSITRVISELRDTGKIIIVTDHGEDHYCLCDDSLVESH